MRLEDLPLTEPLHAARQTVARQTVDRLPLDQLRTVPDHLRSVPQHLADHVSPHVPRRVPERLAKSTRKGLLRLPGLPPRVWASLEPARRRPSGKLVFVMTVVVVVAAVMALRRFAERVDRLVTDQHSARAPRMTDAGAATSAPLSEPASEGDLEHAEASRQSVEEPSEPVKSMAGSRDAS